MISSFVGTVLEAWQEVRIHKTRVMLSLVGVALAVFSLTTVVALGSVMQQTITEQNERSSGRPATLSVYAYNEAGEIDQAALMDAWDATMDRYSIGYSSRLIQGEILRFQFTGAAQNVSVNGVDPAYGEMYRVQLAQGSWFTEGDAQRLAPALVINETMWQQLGSPDIATHPTVTILGKPDTVAVVIGITPSSEWDTLPNAYMLTDSLLAIKQAQPGQPADVQGGNPMGGGPGGGGSIPPQLSAWVPPEISDDLGTLIKRDLSLALGEGATVDIARSDWMSFDYDPLQSVKVAVSGIAGLVLLLGGLSLLNISMVTVKHRIREIGIRRSFGATASRVFFGVMMESIVATFVAGVVGVMASIVVVKNPIVENLLTNGEVSDFPAFPVDAALIGIGIATLLGALTGLLPALVAVRVKVIDAIRY